MQHGIRQRIELGYPYPLRRVTQLVRGDAEQRTSSDNNRPQGASPSWLHSPNLFWSQVSNTTSGRLIYTIIP